MPEPQPLVCPNCGSDRIFSSEEATIDYPIIVTIKSSPNGDVRSFDYTGASYSVNDEGTEFRDQLYCRECTGETKMNALLTPRVYAHCCEPVGDVMKVEEDSDRGADIRWQAICWAAHEGYACGWCSPWQHASEFDGLDDVLDHPSQLAYEAAEDAGRQHLIDEGVQVDG